jgi:hypothetical protein
MIGPHSTQGQVVTFTSPAAKVNGVPTTETSWTEAGKMMGIAFMQAVNESH